MIRFAFAVAALVLAAGAAQAEPTRVTVRAQALDAKFIGTHMGGVKVTLRDAASGKVLAEGITTGGTGDTKRLVSEPRIRGAALAGDDVAGFTATLDLDRPTLVRAEAYGPVGKPAGAINVSSSMWLLPGRDVTGDGWILTFPGLVVEPTVTAAPGGLDLRAKVNLMCGCPIEAGGVWDAANYTVTARLLDGGREVAHTDLAYAGETSMFGGKLGGLKPGDYTLQLTAVDRGTVNVGVADTKVSVPAAPNVRAGGRGRSAR
jgi:hypothetical protein